MNKALVTFGVRDAQALLDISLPTFRQYAGLHGYELLVCDDIPTSRPASWFKVLALRDALSDYDEALWLDADVLIVDQELDIADEIPAAAWQGLVEHHTPDGHVPNHGVWYARRPMVPVLERIWGMLEYLQHPWWEQAAACELLGYDPRQRPMRRVRATELHERTCWLDIEWNSHRDHEAEEPRFWHASVRGPDRGRLMHQKLAEIKERTPL